MPATILAEKNAFIAYQDYLANPSHGDGLAGYVAKFLSENAEAKEFLKEKDISRIFNNLPADFLGIDLHTECENIKRIVDGDLQTKDLKPDDINILGSENPEKAMENAKSLIFSKLRNHIFELIRPIYKELYDEPNKLKKSIKDVIENYPEIKVDDFKIKIFHAFVTAYSQAIGNIMKEENTQLSENTYNSNEQLCLLQFNTTMIWDPVNRASQILESYNQGQVLEELQIFKQTLTEEIIKLRSQIEILKILEKENHIKIINMAIASLEENLSCCAEHIKNNEVLPPWFITEQENKKQEILNQMTKAFQSEDKKHEANILESASIVANDAAALPSIENSQIVQNIEVVEAKTNNTSEQRNQKTLWSYSYPSSALKKIDRNFKDSQASKAKADKEKVTGAFENIPQDEAEDTNSFAKDSNRIQGIFIGNHIFSKSGISDSSDKYKAAFNENNIDELIVNYIEKNYPKMAFYLVL
jgi:hypothetical protein